MGVAGLPDWTESEIIIRLSIKIFHDLGDPGPRPPAPGIGLRARNTFETVERPITLITTITTTTTTSETNDCSWSKLSNEFSIEGLVLTSSSDEL